jgi:hypothetical protein
MDQKLKSATLKLLSYCQANDWAGYDPYDALNSKLFKALPFLNSRIPQLVLTQALKRSPINIRTLALVPKTQNPKALGLFLSAFLKLSPQDLPEREQLIEAMIERLMALRSQDPYWCWGYSFPWQGRAMLVPAAAPNLVCTVFVANALLDAYEQRQDERCLKIAVNAGEYVRDVLYWEDGEEAGFSYPLPTIRGKTHNANFLAGALLCRLYSHTRDEAFLAPAFRVTRYSAEKQMADGSWWYGEAPTQRWIDNFHTGYNLDALRDIGRYAGTTEFDERVKRGFEFYRARFFREDGAPRYFHNRTYPLDVHSVAQSIITLLKFQDLDPGNVALAYSVLGWAMEHMWDERGFFYYRVLRLCTIRTSYMRWSQAWMLLAMSTLLAQSAEPKSDTPPQDRTALATSC